MKKRILYIAIIVLTFAFSFDYKKGLLPKKAAAVSANACDSIRYTNSMKAIFDSQCGGCHSGPFGSGGVDLTTYSNVLAKVVDGRIADRINNTNNPMPPFGLMPASKVDSIMCWIDRGGPQ
jgi:mono/diheme cytochrome c family protein